MSRNYSFEIRILDPIQPTDSDSYVLAHVPARKVLRATQLSVEDVAERIPEVVAFVERLTGYRLELNQVL